MVRNPSRRPALTLVEMLVVLGIIGIVLALLLPRLVTVRSYNNNRSRCANNLKQLGLAVQNYCSTFGDRLPPASQIDSNGVPGSINFWLLPYIEQDGLYRFHYNSKMGGNCSIAKDVESTIRFLICPSDINNVNGVDNNRYAVSSYVANFQLFGWGPEAVGAAKGNFPAYDIANIPDGTSNTVMWTERSATTLGNKNVSTAWGVAVAGADYQGPWFSGTADPGTPQANPSAWQDSVSLPQFDVTSLTGRNPPRSGMVQSYHSGELKVAMCDGSVKNVSSSVSTDAWQKACYPADGSTGADW